MNLVSPLLLLVACHWTPEPLPNPSTETTAEAPRVESVSWTCDADLERWRLDISCAGWTNGGRFYLSEDFNYIEEHGIRSRKASSDGTSDELRLDLKLVTDWREVNAGSSTVFDCNRSPSGLFVVYNRDNEIADCRHFGDNSHRWNDLDSVPSCDESWLDTGY